MDALIAKAEPGRSWAKAPEGSHVAVFVDCIDLGLHSESFQGQPPRNVHKCAFVWQIDEVNPETGKRFEMSKEFTVSMNEKANLRKFLGVWRGKTYTDEEALQGVPLNKMYAVCGLMQVEHKQSKANPDRSYASVVSVVKMPKGVPPIQPLDYVRSEHWKEKIAGAQNAHAVNGDGYPSEWDGYDNSPEDSDSDLPF